MIVAIRPDLAGTRQENDLPGCISWPFRLIALVIVVPVRLLWEALAVIGRFLRRYLLAPLGRVITVLILRPGAWLITTLVVIPLRWLVVTFMIVPGAWIYRRVVAPAGRWLWRWVLRPICVAAGLLILTPVAWMAELTAAVLELLYHLVRPGLAAFGEALLW
ncbi:MAG TPA: hypothetical protein VNW94_17920, partial [Streptosporangiaceae bacterium]|nr:hypothetical protein [Streptosporangiaceae bacterium]